MSDSTSTPALTVVRAGGSLVATLFVLLVAGGLLIADAPAASAAFERSSEDRLRTLTNRDRSARGLPAYRRCAELDRLARQQAKRMADRGRLHHNPRLASQVPRYRRAAENVGFANSVDRVHARFLQSRPHRANVRSRQLSQFGVGVDRRGSRRWVAVVYRQPARGATCR
jgi:uncharacterized protein YkwD